MSGYFRFIDYGDGGEWILIDPHDGWEVAHCYVDAHHLGAHDGWNEYAQTVPFYGQVQMISVATPISASFSIISFDWIIEYPY